MSELDHPAARHEAAVLEAAGLAPVARDAGMKPRAATPVQKPVASKALSAANTPGQGVGAQPRGQPRHGAQADPLGCALRAPRACTRTNCLAHLDAVSVGPCHGQTAHAPADLGLQLTACNPPSHAGQHQLVSEKWCQRRRCRRDDQPSGRSRATSGAPTPATPRSASPPAVTPCARTPSRPRRARRADPASRQRSPPASPGGRRARPPA